ncbi:MAG TPA: TRAP transporter substrate-binding protein [Candidatus Bathyarchaeia archaeon]|nr:TRAP transporter substrate-binding protein [Candidatus Bathyarchaeia archaeon]
MIRSRRFLVLLGLCAGALSLACAVLVPRPAPAQAPITLKLATIVGVEHPFSTSAMKFKEVAEAKSGGRLKIEVYPAGQLAKNGTVMLEGMQLGTVDIGANDTPTIGAKWDPKFLMPDVPFLFQSREQVWKVVDGPVGKELIKRLEPLGAKGFCFGGGWGFRNVLSNKRAVFTPADLKGQTIRVPPVPTLVETMKAFGANPVPMQWGEVYLAMKQGTIDGLELPATTVTSDKFHEITKYYSITRHAYPPGIWTMASAKYNSLPGDLKKVVDESMLAACAQHRQDELKQEAEAFAAMKAKGVQINEVKDLREFQERAQPVWKFLEAKVGKEFFDQVVAEARAAAK